MFHGTAFRLSTYLTLGLSCACVGYAEFPLLPEVGIFAVVVIFSMAVIYRLESRVALLSIPAANRLGLVVGLANLAWAGSRVILELKHPQLTNTDWQLLLVALFGPLLMFLMPAKLARREKHAGDYWGLHAAGLAGAALAAALGEDLICFLLIGLYAVCAVWSLSLFYLERTGGGVAPLPGQQIRQVVTVMVAEDHRSGLRRACRLVALGALVALPAYLLTPRSPAAKLTLGKARVEIGYAADQMTDLNQTGDLKANGEVAFEVLAEQNGEPKLDLSLDQRWRGRILRRYAAGVWHGGDVRLPGITPLARRAPEWTPPHLGTGQYTLTFSVPLRFRTPFLADPVRWVAGESPPVASLTPDGARPWLVHPEGSFYWSNAGGQIGDPHQYVQVYRNGPDPDLSPPFRLIDPDPTDVIRALTQCAVPRVKEYADGVVNDLIRDGKLPADCLDRVRLLPRMEYHNAIAQNFATHLATNPDLTYTTHLKRERKDLDPIEDFLFHTRAGHCERFASALVLMLRSQGIPAVLVLGFKGCEPTEEPGHYVVRHEHAHAWVEVLVPVVTPSPIAGEQPTVRWHWRSLDPTPGGEANKNKDDSDWAVQAWMWLSDLFDDYVANYSAEQRRKALAALGVWVTRADVLASAAAAIGGLVMLRFVRRRGRNQTHHLLRTAGARWFDQLLAVLAPHGFVPADDETPREFATRVSEELRRTPTTAVLAEVPAAWAEAYYESRFGGTPLTPDRMASLDAGLRNLETALG